jgi:5-methylcytosine-specific restriction endonuclease McrA
MADLPKPEKRKPLTRMQFATLILAQDGRCGCGCRKKLQADAIIDEHLVALDFLGGNALDNRSLWDRDCSKAKTARDLSAAAKGKRIRGETGTGPKKAIPSRPFGRMAEGRDPKRWQSAGFSKTLRRKISGKVEAR